MIDYFVQCFILITGALSIWLSQQSNQYLQKYACIVGLIGSPLFMYAAYCVEQWGNLVVAVFIFYSWWVGFLNNWVR